MKLLVGPLEAAGELCAAHAPSHLVSWLSPPAFGPELPASLAPARRLLLSSHDLAEPAEGLVAPAPDHVVQLLEFADAWPGERPMLVHCWAGISRSPAAAFVIACRKRPELAEITIARRLRALSPEATPNPRIVEIADSLLARGGRMSAAIRAIGRGAEAFAGRPFALELG